MPSAREGPLNPNAGSELSTAPTQRPSMAQGERRGG